MENEVIQRQAAMTMSRNHIGNRFECLSVKVQCPSSKSNDALFKLSTVLNLLIKHSFNNPVVYGVHLLDNVDGSKAVCYGERATNIYRSFEDFHAFAHTTSSKCVSGETDKPNKEKKSRMIDWISKPTIVIKVQNQ